LVFYRIGTDDSIKQSALRAFSRMEGGNGVMGDVGAFDALSPLKRGGAKVFFLDCSDPGGGIQAQNTPLYNVAV